MKFDSNLFLKWISPEKFNAGQNEFKLIDLCMLAATDESKKVQGFTVFEPRSFDDKFCQRLKLRRQSPEFEYSKFTLYAPPYLKHRLESIFKNFLEEINVDIVFTSFLNVVFSNNSFFIRDRLRVVCVDDSPVLLKYLSHTFKEMGFVDVVAQVSDPTKAFNTINSLNPDFITMDIQMPGKNGCEVTKEVLQEKYFPIIVISSLNLEEGSQVFEALNSGAFDYIQKPKLVEANDFKDDLRNKMLLALQSQHIKLTNVAKKKNVNSGKLAENLLWCFGSSTGGTIALTEIFTSLPSEIPPTVIVQHIPPVFSKAFAETLNNLCPFKVKEAEDGDMLLANHVYIAPGGKQMGVISRLGKCYISITDAEPVNRFKPSVDYMFNTVAKINGLKVIAALLTGMGKDGAESLLQLKNSGAFTIAQDEKSSAVFGMPRHAIEIGAAKTVVTLSEIAHTFLENSYEQIKKTKNVS